MRDLGCGQGFEETLMVGRVYKMALLRFRAIGYSIMHVSARGERSSSSDCGKSHLEVRTKQNIKKKNVKIFLSLRFRTEEKVEVKMFSGVWVST